MSTEIIITTLTEKEMEEASLVTSLPIILANDQLQSPGGDHMRAAHGTTQSFVFLLTRDNKTSGWRITGGTKEQRRQHYHAVCNKLVAQQDATIRE